MELSRFFVDSEGFLRHTSWYNIQYVYVLDAKLGNRKLIYFRVNFG